MHPLRAGVFLLVAASMPSRSDSHVTLRSPAALVVEDDPCVRRALIRQLHARGMRVTAVASSAAIPAEALPVDVGIFDCEVGAEDGVDIAARLVSQGLVRMAIFFTATEDPRVRLQAAALGLVLDKSRASAADVSELASNRLLRVAC